MKNKVVFIFSIILILFVMSPFNDTFGQNQKPKVTGLWYSPDNTFTIKMPIKLKEIKGEFADESQSGYRSIKLFSAKKSNYSFQVFVLDIVEKNRKLSPKDKFEGLEFVLGGDDDQHFTEKYLKIDGLTAREIIFSEQNSKGLMIDAGDRVFILGLASKNRKDLDSEFAKRFFTSFHLLK